MIDPHLSDKIASIKCQRELDGFLAEFKRRGESVPAENRADLIRKQKELSKKDGRHA